MKKTLIYLLLIALSVIGVQFYAAQELREDNAIYAANQNALMDSVVKYQTESGRNAASVQMLTLDYKTLQEKYSLVKETADELGIKLKRAQSVSTTATKTEQIVNTIIKDSVICRDGKLDTLTTFVWRDPWTDVVGEIKNDSVALGIESRDTLVQIVHRIPHKFWFIKWGTKAIRQEIVTRNPHTQIEYTEYIELKK